jgi:ABC-2 type transport system permease protein
MIAAILHAQWRSMQFGRGSVFGIIASVIWYGIWTLLALLAAFIAADAPADALRQHLPFALAGICAYWQLIPMVSASLGASLDMKKLLAYPVPHRQLFLVEVLLRLTTALEMLLLLTGGLVGLCRNPEAGGVAALPRMLLAILFLIVFNLLLASGMRSILERLLAKRRVREVLAVLMAMIWVLPRFLVSSGYQPKAFEDAGDWVQMVAFPWTAAARAVLGQSEWLSLLSLGAWTVAALWFGRFHFERSLKYDAVAVQATAVTLPTASGSRVDRFYRWPSMIWSDPLAGIVEKELRSLARTPRFRMVFVMGFTFGLLVWFPVMAGRPSAAQVNSPYFLIVVCVYALILLGQVSYWNAFGFDRSAAAFYFAAPPPLSRVLLGKNIASLVYVYLEVLILTAVTVALRLARGWVMVMETLLVIGVCALFMLAVGNISSVWYPRASNPERVSQGGGSGRHGLIFILYPLTLLPVFLAYLARYAFDSNWAFGIVLGFAAILGAALYGMAMQSAVSRAATRREEFLGELSKSEGPVVAG